MRLLSGARMRAPAWRCMHRQGQHQLFMRHVRRWANADACTAQAPIGADLQKLYSDLSSAPSRRVVVAESRRPMRT